jgi:PAS domain S-box-containing protein
MPPPSRSRPQVAPAKAAPKKASRANREPVEKQTARELFEFVVEQGKKDYQVQRYKGLGEMTSPQLWETTMDPSVRTLLQVKLEDIAETEHIFTTLMGEDVEARRKFIEDNAWTYEESGYLSLRWTRQSSAREPLASARAAFSPLRYGVAAVIVVTVAYTLLGIVPMTLRNLQLLKEVAAEDGQGIQLAGELRYQLEEGRRSLENVILSAGSLAQRNQAVRSMREVDARIAKTESSITQLSTSPVELNPQFHQKWITYLADRDRLIQISESGGAADASDGHQARSSTAGAGGKFDTEREAADFLQVDQAAARWEKEFQSDSDRKVGEISRSLRNALSDWLSVVVLKVLILALLIWTDWKRRRVERELRTATEELRASQDRLQLAYGSSAVGMGIISMDGTILSVNGVAARMLSYEPTEMIGKRVRDFIAPEFQQGHIEHLASLADHRISSYQAERQYIRKDGTAVWIRNNVNCMRLKCGERQCFFTSEDITHQKLANDRLAFLAHFDPVTSLPNRHSFEEQLAEALEPMPRCPACVALLYLEIDSFDFLKGTFGSRRCGRGA